MTQLNNQQVIKAKVMKDQTKYLNKNVRQGEKGVTSYYIHLFRRQGNDFLSAYLLISPLAHPKYANPQVRFLFVHLPYWSHNGISIMRPPFIKSFNPVTFLILIILFIFQSSFIVSGFEYEL
ncbi:MAG: hypothetical protein EZS28_003488 [Streblomastix strix]|uniref:Uncharacterized protein n=1 Tax=Streblomastix strix TaxID=222440 RepID=A0A5J4X101_9EUKA|nr:MAG: hypothetical protein EZS28_003488 [Streblomastix strix]